MSSEVIAVEPDTVQFNRQSSQTIKVINKTKGFLKDFFFCLYNEEKFAFSPDSFSLAPNQHKLVTITLKIKTSKSIAKEFVYLKSSDLSKRIVILINNLQSPEAKQRHTEEGVQDANTLSSRDYRQLQMNAVEKISQEKEAYILRLQREMANRNSLQRSQGSFKGQTALREQIQELELRAGVLSHQKSQILRENYQLQEKFEEYRKLCEIDLRNYEQCSILAEEQGIEIKRLQEEVRHLEEQGNLFLRRIAEKEDRIKEVEALAKKAVEDERREHDKKAQTLQQKLNQQKQIQYRQQQDQEHNKQQVNQLQRELRKKEEDIKSLQRQVEDSGEHLKEKDSDKKKMIKVELLNEVLTNRSNELAERVKELEVSNNSFREELIVYKNRVAEYGTSSDKVGQYMELALESCKGENEALKKSKKEFEKSLAEFMELNQENHTKMKSLNDQLVRCKEEVNILSQLKESLQRRNQQVKQQHHFAMMQLRSQNIELLEKISLGESARKESEQAKLLEELSSKQRQIEKGENALEQCNQRVSKLEQENERLNQRVRRFKKEAKKELRSINDTAIDELKRIHGEKKALTHKVLELEELLENNSVETRFDRNGMDRSGVDRSRTREKSRDRVDRNIEQDRRERSGSIQHQRNPVSATTEQWNQQDVKLIYSELKELKEMDSYLKSEEERFVRIFSIEQPADTADLGGGIKPLYRVIKFFKLLEDRIRELRNECGDISSHKMQSTKGRPRDSEAGKDEKQQENSSINLSKTRLHCSQLLQFVRMEMKNQYKKLNDTLRLSEAKYEILKRKVYEQYRSKLIDLLNKKDRTSLPQIQATLERFIEGMSNMSHKEALLHKETKLKLHARKQVNGLKERNQELNHLIQIKKGVCTRQPLKIMYSEGELEWQECLKREAEFLTLSAENQRMKEELSLVESSLAERGAEMQRMQAELQEKGEEIARLKKNTADLQKDYQIELQKQAEIIEENKQRIMDISKTTKETSKSVARERECSSLREDLERKKEIIKGLREKEKVLQQLLQETNRNEEREKRKASDEHRILDSMRDLKESNRELRGENSRIKEKLARLQEELEKKSAYLKTLKGDVEENRVRTMRKEELEMERMKEEIHTLSQQVRKYREQVDKLKKSKQRELAQLQGELDRAKNSELLSKKTLESIIRALVETVRRVYSRLRLIIKKQKGRQIGQVSVMIDLTGEPGRIDATKVDDLLEEPLTMLEG